METDLVIFNICCSLLNASNIFKKSLTIQKRPQRSAGGEHLPAAPACVYGQPRVRASALPKGQERWQLSGWSEIVVRFVPYPWQNQMLEILDKFAGHAVLSREM